MLRRLKIKFVASTMLVLIVFFVVIISFINISTYRLTQQQNLTLLTTIAENDGSKPYMKDFHSFYDPWFFSRTLPMAAVTGDGNTQDETGAYPVSYFYVTINHLYQIQNIVNRDQSLYSDDTVVEMCNTVINSEDEHGKIGYNMYLIQKKSYGYIIVFLDTTVSELQSEALLKSSITIGLISLVFLLFISMFLAHFMIKPVSETMLKQEQFISDASHELKTPIAVISANADVLETEVGDNKWLSFIKSEASRMSTLVNNLLTLAKIDDERNHMIFTCFDMSKAVLSIALPFESVAFEKEVAFEMNIPDAITVNGAEEHIKQVIAILTDNAIKHAPNGGKVILSLKKIGDKAVFEIVNSGPTIPPEELGKIFERFYRSDKARTGDSSNSFGLGLAIAKSIITTHKGKIDVYSANGWTSFSFTLKTHRQKGAAT